MFTTDVGPGAGVQDDVEREPRVEDFASERPVVVGVVDGLLDSFEAEGELPSQEDEDLVDLQRVGGNDDALDQLVRIALDEEVVLERRGLGFVTVDDEVGHGRLSQHRPLSSGRKARTTTTEQRRLVHFGGDLFGQH